MTTRDDRDFRIKLGIYVDDRLTLTLTDLLPYIFPAYVCFADFIAMLLHACAENF